MKFPTRWGMGTSVVFSLKEKKLTVFLRFKFPLERLGESYRSPSQWGNSNQWGKKQGTRNIFYELASPACGFPANIGHQDANRDSCNYSSDPSAVDSFQQACLTLFHLLRGVVWEFLSQLIRGSKNALFWLYKPLGNRSIGGILDLESKGSDWYSSVEMNSAFSTLEFIRENNAVISSVNLLISLCRLLA